MKICQNSLSTSHRSCSGAVALLLLLSWLAVGCSSPPAGTGPLSKNTGITNPYPTKLKKKIGIVPFEVQTTQGGQVTREIFQDYVLEALQTECPGQVFIQPGDADYPQILGRLHRFDNGLIDNLSLALIGRQLGLNAIILGTLTSISFEEKEKGIWFFKGIRYYVRADMLVEVYDTETAAKLLDRSVTRSIKIDDLDAQMIRMEKRIDIGLIEELIEIMADLIDDKICSAAGDQAWKSYIVSSGEDEVMISSGEKYGLRPGRVLEVFDSNTIIEGMQKQRYFMPGKKVAEIQVKTVTADRARAIVLSGGDIRQWSVVKVKKR